MRRATWDVQAPGMGKTGTKTPWWVGNVGPLHISVQKLPSRIYNPWLQPMVVWWQKNCFVHPHHRFSPVISFISPFLCLWREGQFKPKGRKVCGILFMYLLIYPLFLYLCERDRERTHSLAGLLPKCLQEQDWAKFEAKSWELSMHCQGR